MSSTVFPPGPKSFLGLENVRRFADNTLEFIQSVHEEYGDTVSFRMGPFRAYFFFHPDQIKEILVIHSKKLPKFKNQVRVLAQWDGNGLLLSEGEFWQRQHRLVQPAFAPQRFQGYARVMVDSTKQRLDRWKPGSELIVDSEMNTLTLEIISECLFGANVRHQSQELEKAVQILSEISVNEMKRLFIPLRWLPTAHNRRKFWAMNLLDKTIRGFIQTRRESGKDHGDLLSMLLLATDAEASGARMTDEQARDEAMVLFLAGHDTTATALAWTWYLLGRHPEVEKRAIQEVKEVLGGKEVTHADLPKLRYLRQIIQESIRLYPPAIGTFARQNEEEIQVGGYSIPKKSIVYTFSYVTQRDKRWFADPTRFDPDRFSAERAEHPPFAYFPFGAGPRACIGMHFAMMEMQIILATILQRFRLVPLEPVEVKPTVLLSLRPSTPLRYKVEAL